MLILALALGLAGEPVVVDGGEVIEVVVEKKQRRKLAFATLDDPRVQAFFRSGSSTGASLISGERSVERRPLVRAGSVRVLAGVSRVATSRAERREVRRFARALVNEARPELEACYVETLGRAEADTVRLTVRVELSRSDRGPVRLSEGMLGDVLGNACVHGVLEFADAEAPLLDASVEIPVWFWVQTNYGPGPS